MTRRRYWWRLEIGPGPFFWLPERTEFGGLHGINWGFMRLRWMRIA